MQNTPGKSIEIIAYQNAHQSGIDTMMKAIALEFNDNISPKPSNNTPIVPDQYWVAINNNEIIGTVGVITLNKDFAILKRMMLKKKYRGKTLGISRSLLETVINWCENHNIKKLYLGTMTQFKAAQSFYSNNGFIRISEEQLPNNFLSNPLDTVFFVRDLTTSI
jgi:N-acetylglutamate synthase-like GNAT family acetyltransferase